MFDYLGDVQTMPQRAGLRSLGLFAEDLEKPFVGIVVSGSGMTRGAEHLKALAEYAAEGVRSAGGVCSSGGVCTVGGAPSEPSSTGRVVMQPAAKQSSSAASARALIFIVFVGGSGRPLHNAVQHGEHGVEPLFCDR